MGFFNRKKSYNFEKCSVNELNSLPIETVVAVLEDTSYYRNYPHFSRACDCILSLLEATEDFKKTCGLLYMQKEDKVSYGVDSGDVDNALQKIQLILSDMKKNVSQLNNIPMFNLEKGYVVLANTCNRATTQIAELTSCR